MSCDGVLTGGSCTLPAEFATAAAAAAAVVMEMEEVEEEVMLGRSILGSRYW